jgi:hypothetical protein
LWSWKVPSGLTVLQIERRPIRTEIILLNREPATRFEAKSHTKLEKIPGVYPILCARRKAKTPEAARAVPKQTQREWGIGRDSPLLR